MKRITAIVLSVGLLSACNSFAAETPTSNPFNKILTAVPAAELPAKAASLVSQAKPLDRQQTTINVVKSALRINPAAAPAIVGAIVRAVPEMASVAAGTAAAEQPKQATAIAKAAAAAAPVQAGAIVEAVCRAVPKEYQSIAIAVSQVAPKANKEIMNAVAAAVPSLKPAIERVVSGYNGNVLSVADSLAQAATVAQVTPGSGAAPSTVTSRSSSPTALAGAPMARGPATGPPYTPLTKTPTNVTSGTSGAVPTGGRDYAKP